MCGEVCVPMVAVCFSTQSEFVAAAAAAAASAVDAGTAFGGLAADDGFFTASGAVMISCLSSVDVAALVEVPCVGRAGGGGGGG